MQYPTASQLVWGVARAVDQIIQRCLKPRDERYATAEELLADLESARSGGLLSRITALFWR